MKKQDFAWSFMFALLFSIQYGVLILEGDNIWTTEEAEFSLRSFLGGVLGVAFLYLLFWGSMSVVGILVSFFVGEKNEDFSWDIVRAVKICCCVSFALLLFFCLWEVVMWTIQP